jgi:hypothetical protein
MYLCTQFVEKGFILNISKFCFNSLILLLNLRLFWWVFSAGQFPLYLLGEIFDTFMKLYKSGSMLMKSRKIVNSLKALPDVKIPNSDILETTCIICLEEMT